MDLTCLCCVAAQRWGCYYRLKTESTMLQSAGQFGPFFPLWLWWHGLMVRLPKEAHSLVWTALTGAGSKSFWVFPCLLAMCWLDLQRGAALGRRNPQGMVCNPGKFWQKHQKGICWLMLCSLALRWEACSRVQGQEHQERLSCILVCSSSKAFFLELRIFQACQPQNSS